MDREPLLQGGGPGDANAVADDVPFRVRADGYLKKRNRWGFWQKRFFELDGLVLKYYSDHQHKKPRPPLTITGVELNGRFGDFDVETETRDLALRAASVKDAELWVNKIEQAEVEADRMAEESKRISKPKRPAAPVVLKQIEGYLEMPSGIRFKPWQDRYFRVQNSSLFYYSDNSKAVDDYEGEIVLVDARGASKSVVELTDSSNGRGFVLRTAQKDYPFKAPTEDMAKDWVAALQQRIEVAFGNMSRRESEEKQDLPQPSTVPKWIEQWDKESDADHVLKIQAHLDNLFPVVRDKDFRKNTLNAVTVLIEELDDKARECLPQGGVRKGLTLAGRKSRADIFETILRFFHIRIVNELSQFVTDQSYENLSVRELLRFMDLITAYDTKIREMLDGEVGKEIYDSLPPFGLLDNAENMALRYSQVCEKQISEWVDNVCFETRMQGVSRVSTRLDGRYQTPGPTDIFNLLDQALALGKVSGVKRLQSEIAAMCAVSLGVYVHSVTQDLVRTKADSLPYACAIANDCWSILEHVGKLESEHRNDTYKVDFEPVRERCASSADRCLEVLAAMVHSDLRSTMDRVFTKEHLESMVDSEDCIAVVCATLDDYLEDFQVLLELPFVSRVARMIVRDIVGSYLTRMAYAYSVERKVALSKREINLVALDRKRIVACLEKRFPGLNIKLIFANEIGPFDDVIDMLTSSPDLIPQTAVMIAQKDPHIRRHIENTAKMCVDLACNAAGVNDKMVKEIKALIVTEMDDKVHPPDSEPMAEDRYELFEKNAFVRMWPTLKKPTFKKAAEGKANAKVSLQEEVKPVVVIDSNKVAEEKQRLQKQNSMKQWRPKRDSDAPSNTPEEELVMGPPAPSALTPLQTGLLQFRDAKSTVHNQYFCSIRPISETHANDYEFVVCKGKTPANPVAFRVRISDIARVDYWEESGPRHFGPDGKQIEDVPIGVRMTKNVEWAIAKNASEFSIATKNGDKVHFIAESSAEGTQWAKNLKEKVTESFDKWGNSFVEGQQEYLKMTNKQLVELGKKKGLDMRGCTERQELIRILKANAPLLETATPVKQAESKPKPTPAAVAAPVAVAAAPVVTATTAESPRAADPGLTLSSGMFSSKKPEPTVAASSTPAPAVATKLTETASAPAMVKTSGPLSKPVEVSKPETVLAPSIIKTSEPLNKPLQANKPSTNAAAVPVTTSAATLPTVASFKETPSKPIAKNGTAATTAAPALTSTSTTQTSTAGSTTAALAPPISTATSAQGIDSFEEKVLEVQSLIVRGHLLLEDGDPVQASRLFKRAKELAEVVQSIQLKAKATAGLAASYRDHPPMRRAAGPLFEVAATLFAASGDTSDRINVLQEAADVYLSQGMATEAIKSLERFDNLQVRNGNPPVFTQRIQQIRATMN